MARSRTKEPSVHYYLPARRLDGTRAEVLAQLDEILVSLAGLRQLVSLHGPDPGDVPIPKLRLVKRFVKRSALILGIVLLALPASAQVPEGTTATASTGGIATSQQPQPADSDWNGPPDLAGLRHARVGANDARTHQTTLLFGGIWVIGNQPGAW